MLSRPDSAVFSPGPAPRTVRTADCRVVAVPDGWELLPPGDAGLTRRVKGQRREVRRQLAEHSRRLLDRYRRGEAGAANCPLRRALEGMPVAEER